MPTSVDMLFSTSGTGAAHKVVPGSSYQLPPWPRVLGSCSSSAAGPLLVPVQVLLSQGDLQRVNPAARALIGDSSRHPPWSQAAQVIYKNSAIFLFDTFMGHDHHVCACLFLRDWTSRATLPLCCVNTFSWCLSPPFHASACVSMVWRGYHKM